MRSKQAWLRVVEASVAVMILIGFVMVSMNKAQSRETNLQEKVNELVLKIEKNSEVREKIFSGDLQEDDLDYLIKDYDYTFKIEGSGKEPPTDKEIFAASIFLYSTDSNKKFTLYIWN